MIKNTKNKKNTFDKLLFTAYSYIVANTKSFQKGIFPRGAQINYNTNQKKNGTQKHSKSFKTLQNTRNEIFLWQQKIFIIFGEKKKKNRENGAKN